MSLTPFRDAVALVLNLAGERRLPAEVCSLSDAVGRVLAQDVMASEMLPAFHGAALDGFALASTLEVSAFASGTRLAVEGRILAGEAFFTNCVNSEPHAHRIMTGAPVPPCAHTVVGKEDVTEAEGVMTLRREIPLGFAVRPIGSDIEPGACLARRGERVTPGHALVFAALGISSVSVTARPRVAICATGAELLPADRAELPFGSIRDSSTPFLLAALRGWGIEATAATTLIDDRAAIEQWLGGLHNTNVVVTTGGVSVGDADHLRASLEGVGATIHLHGVAMRPGKPLLIATLPAAQGGAIVLALPGNPYASAAGAHFFVRPCLTALQGGQLPRLCAATVRGHVRTPPGLTCVWRANARVSAEGRLEVVVHPARDSYRVTAFKETNAWAVVEGTEAGIADGAGIRVSLDDAFDGGMDE